MAATVIEIPILAAIKGIIGFKNPEYASVIKCPVLSDVMTFLFLSIQNMLPNKE